MMHLQNICKGRGRCKALHIFSAKQNFVIFSSTMTGGKTIFWISFLENALLREVNMMKVKKLSDCD